MSMWLMAQRCMTYMHMLVFQTRICNLHTAAGCSHVTMLSALEDEEYGCLQGQRLIFLFYLMRALPTRIAGQNIVTNLMQS